MKTLRTHIEPPSDASKTEVNIHTLLDSLGVHKINIPECVKSEARMDSKKIQSAFARVQTLNSNASNTPSQVPSLLMKRMRMRQDVQK